MSAESSYTQFLSWILFGTKLFGGLLATLTIVLYANQERILYIPNPPGFPKTPNENPPGWTSPNDWTVSGRQARATNAEERIPFDEKFVATSDGVIIHTWLLLRPDAEKCPTLIYFHGNAGNMGFRLQNAARMYALSKVNVLMVDYRGYGSSEGQPTERGLNLDADAVLKYARSHPRSLGGAVSIALAQRNPDSVAAVIVENTFLSISHMVDALMPAIAPLKFLVLTMKWDSSVKIQSLAVPIMFIAGDRDELVPHEHMLQLHQLAGRSRAKELYIVKGGSHNGTWERGGSEYYLRILNFLEQHILAQLKLPSPPGESAAPAATAVESRAPREKDDEDYYIVDK